MKKLLLAIAVTLALVATSNAQVFTSSSFLNATSLTVSNLLGVTNLTSYIISGASNRVGTVYTNLAGTKVVVGTNAAQGSTFNLLKTIALTADRNGTYAPPVTYYGATNDTLAPGPYSGNIYIRAMAHGTNDNSVLTFVFAAVPNYDSIQGTGNEDVTAASLIAVTVTLTATATPYTVRTALDASKLIGCGGLMLRSVSNADADANSAVDVFEVSYNRFVP